jgi:hypothetical protein
VSIVIATSYFSHQPGRKKSGNKLNFLKLVRHRGSSQDDLIQSPQMKMIGLML